MEKIIFKVNPNPTTSVPGGIWSTQNSVIVKWQKGLACWMFTHIHEKKIFKVNPNPTAGIGRDMINPKLTHSQVNKGSSMLDPHPHSWIFFFKIYYKPTAGIGRGITKPNLTYSQVHKRSNMLDPHLKWWKWKFSKWIPNPLLVPIGVLQSQISLTHKWTRGLARWIPHPHSWI